MAPMRRTLIITDKPSNSRVISPHWQDRFPRDVITLFHTPPMGSFRFRLPRDLPISNVPIVMDPVLERRPPEGPSPSGTAYFDGDFGALAREADHIVCATDFDPAGCRNFLDLMAQYQIDTPLSDISWLALTALDPASFTAGIEKGRRADDPELALMAAFGQARQHFDYLYALNALPVFGIALRAVGIEPRGAFSFLSKYTLQLLLLLSQGDHGPLKWGDIIKLMSRNSLGSPISRGEIVYWLRQSGCLAQEGHDKPERYILSDRGLRLASLMHKDCYDPHLNSRLRSWGDSWPASKPAIERYIRTFFGKEKRYLFSRI